MLVLASTGALLVREGRSSSFASARSIVSGEEENRKIWTDSSAGKIFASRCPLLGLLLPLLLTGCILEEADWSSVRLEPFFEPPAQPNLSDGSGRVSLADTSTYHGVLQGYDRLKEAHPSYIRKRVLGKATDGVPVYAYYLTPGTYENTVLVTAGLHGNEKMSVWSLLFFLRILAREGAETSALKDLRTNIRLVVVPVANPTGFTDDTRQNRNGVDLNRNFGYRWEGYVPTADSAFGYDYKGARPHSEPETRLLGKLFQEYSSATAYLDLHNFGSSEYHWPWYLPENGPNDNAIYRQVVSAFWEDGQVVRERHDSMPKAHNYAANAFGIHASTPEFSLALFGEKPYDSAGMTAAVRWYGNLIMGHAKLDRH